MDRNDREEVTRATTELFTNGQTEHITIPRPLRPLLAWRKREPLIVVLESPDVLRIISLEKFMQDAILQDRRERAAAAAAGAK